MSRVPREQLLYGGNKSAVMFHGFWYCCTAGAEAFPELCPRHDLPKEQPERLELDEAPLSVGSSTEELQSNKSLTGLDSVETHNSPLIKGIVIGVALSAPFWAIIIILFLWHYI